MAYLPNIPQANQRQKDSQPQIQNNYAEIEALIIVNHVDFDTGNAGKHFFVEFPVQVADQVTTAGEVGMYSKTSALTAVPELYIRKQNAGTVIEFTSTANSSSSSVLGATGYTRLPSGILLKWGNAGGLVAGNPITVTLPTGASIPVFTSIYNIQLTPMANAATSAGANTAVTLISDFSNPAQFQVWLSSRDSAVSTTTTLNFQYLIIGV